VDPHHPAHGLVISLPLFGQGAQPEAFSQLFSGQQAFYQQGAISAPYYRRLEGPFEIAHEGLEDVGRRDESFDVAALVDHERQG
jgi:hypothetical protein